MKRGSHVRLFTLWVVATTSPFLAFSQELPELLVVGAVHFNNPGRDAINFEMEDVLSDRRQAEIEELVSVLAEYNPTHIAVEVLSSNQKTLDERYANYRYGEYELSRNEVDQIGLRLAAKLNHDRIYAIDWNGNPPGDIETDYDWHSYGLANGFEASITQITDSESASEYYIELGPQTVSTWLKQLNDSDALAASHRAYFDISMIGRGEDLIGANWVGTWYARNLKIFSRLVRMAENPTDRVLVIYGQAHAYLLRQFSAEYEAFKVINLNAVLKD